MSLRRLSISWLWPGRTPVLLLLLVTGLAGADLDRDSLPDKFEQKLLERFVPQFLVSANDCDVLPSEFATDELSPRAIKTNGPLYGFVTPHPNGDIEMHYYHLWARDCGRGSHPLDIEHVSVLLRSASQKWYAVAWTAAGHQGTICDTAHGVRAHLVDAAQKGPTVWVSHGKHASFLSQELCSRGCGGDRCEKMRPWKPREVINVGSVEHPLNGALWIQSRPFAAKLRAEFTPAVETVIGQTDGIANLYPVLVPVKATVLAGGSTLNAIGTSTHHAEASLVTVTDSVRRAKRAVSNFLNRW